MTKFNFPTYLINLEHEHQRKKNSLKQLDELEITPKIVTAYNGHQKDFPFNQYHHLSRGKWWEKDVFKPGAFACYLSHAKCWKEIAMDSAPYALILEDDMIINQEEFQKFDIDNIPNSFDVLFVNIGVTRLLKLTSSNKSLATKDFASLNDTLLDLLIHNKFNDDLTPGGYGYIVSKQGAVKLLRMMEQDKICMGVDYAIIFNSLSNDDIETIKTLKEVPHYLQVYLNNINDDASSSNYERSSLNSYIYTLSALITPYHGESNIKHEIFTDFNVFDHNVLNKLKSYFSRANTYIKGKM